MTAPYTLHLGDCIDVLRTLPDNSVDAIVTDPPYGLSSEPDMAEVLRHWLAGDDYQHKGGGFMGKTWDSFVPGPAVWREVLRVLKPGGHLLSFFGSRTYDMGTLAIRLAGFEIRDQALWVYGSGFPKSLDVSKAIDKANGKHDRDLAPFGSYVREMREAKGWTLRQLDEAMGTNTAASWWEGRKAGVQPPGLEQYRKLKTILDMDNRFDELIEWLEAEREVVGSTTKARSTSGASALPTVGGETVYKTWDITAPATDDAQQWSGWGTALKPAHEPVCVARKPLEKGLTVAANVLKWGTGAINVDACRIGEESTRRATLKIMTSRGIPGDSYANQDHRYADRSSSYPTGSDAGRWPANLIHDGSPEVVALFPEQESGSRAAGVRKGMGFHGADGDGGPAIAGSAGSAARFFYCAKASRKDRNEGLPSSDEPVVAKDATMRHCETADWSTRNGNHHPTVKPTDLMAYLVRLVTPPGGLVLDPFMGSGSTGKACMREGFRFTGIDMTPEYVAIARQRIEHEHARMVEASKPPPLPPQLDLFAMPTSEGDANAA